MNYQTLLIYLIPILFFMWIVYFTTRIVQIHYYYKKFNEAQDITWEQAPRGDMGWLKRKCDHFDESIKLMERLKPFGSWKLFPLTKEEKEFLFTPMRDDYGL